MDMDKYVFTKHGEKVVPRMNMMYEVDPEGSADYFKIRVPNFKGLEKTLKDDLGISEYTFITQFPELSEDTTTKNQVEDYGVEVIILKLPGKTIIAPCCALYVLSNEGKTHDSLHCYGA